MAFRWGFIGSGRIIPRFMGGFTQVKEAVPAAIYARNREKGQALADQYGFEKVFDDLEAFVKEADIDIAYIALPHTLHPQFAIKCLNAGIPVLCEKPMAANRKQEEDMIKCARMNGTFLMEAFWTRAFPATRQAVKWIREGRIGRVVAVDGAFTDAADYVKGDRLFEPSMAGGALLDIGVYLIQAANLVFGKAPDSVAALANIDKHGVDDCCGMTLKYGGGIATLFCSFMCKGKDTLTIYGTGGTIEIDENFWSPRTMRLITREGVTEYPEAGDETFEGEGFQFEIRHVHGCLAEGLKESPLMTLDQSLGVISTCDEIRRQCGLVYPFEK